jgi:replicative DNA helicase
VQLGNDFTKVSKEQRKTALNQLGAMPLYILDQYGNGNLDQIISTVRYAVRRYGVKIALIDHLGFLLDPDKEERLETQRAVRELATIAKEDQCTIFLICHPNNMAVSQQRRVKITDLKGASAVRQDAHVGVVVERQEITQDNPYPRTTLWFDKVRSEFGRAGSHCTLAFDPVACAYADEWNETPAGSRGAKIIVPN